MKTSKIKFKMTMTMTMTMKKTTMKIQMYNLRLLVMMILNSWVQSSMSGLRSSQSWNHRGLQSYVSLIR